MAQYRRITLPPPGQEQRYIIGRASKSLNSTSKRVEAEDSLYFNERTISKRHAEIIVKTDDDEENVDASETGKAQSLFRIQDRYSLHGTAINGRYIPSSREVFLFPGDYIELVLPKSFKDNAHLSGPAKIALKFTVEDNQMVFERLDPKTVRSNLSSSDSLFEGQDSFDVPISAESPEQLPLFEEDSYQSDSTDGLKDEIVEIVDVETLVYDEDNDNDDDNEPSCSYEESKDIEVDIQPIVESRKRTYQEFIALNYNEDVHSSSSDDDSDEDGVDDEDNDDKATSSSSEDDFDDDNGSLPPTKKAKVEIEFKPSGIKPLVISGFVGALFGASVTFGSLLSIGKNLST